MHFGQFANSPIVLTPIPSLICLIFLSIISAEKKNDLAPD
ncbi:hypothetical protein BAGQ_3567 [Bacillus velezensis]|nr:hypothetical protein BAGQ_3567 [Bacillus velezensis]